MRETQTTGWYPTCTCYRTRDPRKLAQQKAMANQLKALADRLKELEDLDMPSDFPMVQFIRNRMAALMPLTWESRVATSDAPTVPAVVLDPFVGSGTVPMVARALGRHGVGLDLSFDYLRDQARVRLELDKLAAWGNGGQQVQAAWEELPLFAEREGV